MTDLARVAALRNEGMPGPWIAEDQGLTPGQLRGLGLGDPAAATEWRRAWASIRHDGVLRALHEEFTPSGRFHRP